MAHNSLPDTHIAAVAISENVYTYMQSYQGVIIECQGAMMTVKGTPKSEVVHRYQGGREDVRPEGPKLFTPLAAAYMQPNNRHVFYLDDKNILRGYHFNTSSRTFADTGLASLNVEPSASITRPRTGRRAIKMVSFSTKNNRWVQGAPDMIPVPPPPQPPVNVRDPPLYGTSLAAVPTRPGIGFVTGSDAELPVAFLQWDNFALAHSQGSEVEVIRTLNLRFAPHTALTTIDDGKGVHLFYTSSRDNLIKRVLISDGRASAAQEIARPTPRSALAAVIPQQRQTLDDVVGVVALEGMTLTRPVTAGSNPSIWATPTTKPAAGGKRTYTSPANAFLEDKIQSVKMVNRSDRLRNRKNPLPTNPPAVNASAANTLTAKPPARKPPAAKPFPNLPLCVNPAQPDLPLRVNPVEPANAIQPVNAQLALIRVAFEENFRVDAVISLAMGFCAALAGARILVTRKGISAPDTITTDDAIKIINVVFSEMLGTLYTRIWELDSSQYIYNIGSATLTVAVDNIAPDVVRSLSAGFNTLVNLSLSDDFAVAVVVLQIDILRQQMADIASKLPNSIARSHGMQGLPPCSFTSRPAPN
ncbi:hypothetical protein QBC46DRAFT_418178 [Diplogelasinospora grovesii]|uniref:Uncharacterized protein n=1 Tax=Diplogelasinospora grovesii TaxID=303347 RepID=A0AAN6S1A4_9PEZI|nr:hypothetical protein QBC46DRAFT_418178 [Diplogelasinospora grovesii]